MCHIGFYFSSAPTVIYKNSPVTYDVTLFFIASTDRA